LGQLGFGFCSVDAPCPRVIGFSKDFVMPAFV